MKTVRVAIVVLNWNGWQDTLACIASLRALAYADVQIVLVDNGSTDGSVGHFAREVPSVELLQTGANLGFGGGCNKGIRLALSRGLARELGGDLRLIQEKGEGAEFLLILPLA